MGRSGEIYELKTNTLLRRETFRALPFQISRRG